MTKLAPLDRVVHKNLRVQDEAAFAACKSITMCAVALEEIPRIVVEYPVAFTRNTDTDQYVCVALFGIDPTENLYWREGRWSSYCVPLNVGRQPFFAGVGDQPPAEGQENTLITCIDMENPGVQDAAGEALFDATGNESPYLKHKMTLLAELIEGERRAREFTERMHSLELIKPMHIEIKLSGLAPRKIGGLFSIDEKGLRALDATTLHDLHTRGYLHVMHAMISSLGHLQIFARRSAAIRAAVPPALA